jgi:hypothetical protein
MTTRSLVVDLRGEKAERQLIVPAAADGVPDSSQQLQDSPDHHEDDPESPKNRDREQKSSYQQDNTKDDHDAPPGVQ